MILLCSHSDNTRGCAAKRDLQATCPSRDSHTRTPTTPHASAVADPFLHQHTDGALYVFFETKSNSNNQGDIAAARSSDGGASWHYLGIALDEPWHLSYPFVFTWEDEVRLHVVGSLT